MDEGPRKGARFGLIVHHTDAEREWAYDDAALFGAGVSVVTKKTILGGYYGFTVLIAGANNRLQGTEIDQNPF